MSSRWLSLPFGDEGYVNFGGGEKDLLILIPWILWSLIYLAIFIVIWCKRMPLLRGVVYSTAGATTLLGLIWGGMFLWFSGLLGIS